MGLGEQACLYVGSHDDSSTPAGSVPSNEFPFGAKPPEEAAPPELAECFSLPPTSASGVRPDRCASGEQASLGSTSPGSSPCSDLEWFPDHQAILAISTFFQ